MKMCGGCQKLRKCASFPLAVKYHLSTQSTVSAIQDRTYLYFCRQIWDIILIKLILISTRALEFIRLSGAQIAFIFTILNRPFSPVVRLYQVIP